MQDNQYFGVNVNQLLQTKYTMLSDNLKKINSLVVAFSGGVDSTFLLFTALQSLGKDSVLAVTACSPTFPKSELEETINFTKKHSIPHRLITTDEVETINKQGNTPDRCYYCKHGLFSTLTAIAKTEGYQMVVEGSNIDDDHDYRPGRKAIRELGICSPLKEAGLSKEDIRELSHHFDLPTWNKPAYACLTSRFQYYVDITPEALARIEKSEEYLKELGFRQCRVRHYDHKARIEVALDKVPEALSRADEIVTKLLGFGYTEIEIDPKGYRTGSMNVFRE
ncbi:MAG: ATP-dependent sacrificial sulfur transferase LarE [Spirochaetales bacterium]|nr:ATP-dependent sacrificial sulfur transferase LarE [Spirochaetales bacterium]